MSPLAAPDWEQERLMVVGAHAFDAEVMAGGAVASCTANGGAAAIVHMTLGELGSSTLSPHEYGARKRLEATRAGILLKSQVRLLDYRDAFIPDGDDAAVAVNELIREWRPTTVVTHWKGSPHKDHVRTHHAVVQGVFYAGLKHLDDMPPSHQVRTVLFAENWEDAGGFEPDLFCDISSAHDVWMQALSCYEIGREHSPGFPYRDYYECLARLRGCLAGVEYAEAFMMPKPDVMRLLGLSGGLLIP